MAARQGLVHPAPLIAQGTGNPAGPLLGPSTGALVKIISPRQDLGHGQFGEAIARSTFSFLRHERSIPKGDSPRASAGFTLARGGTRSQNRLSQTGLDQVLR